MQKTLFTLALVAASFAAPAQAPPTAAPAVAAAPTDPYTSMMAATIKEMLSTSDGAVVQQAIDKFERAAAVRAADWLPRYYQAYGYVRLGFLTRDGDQQDKYFDRAQTALDQARKLLGADASELSVMQAYLYQGRIMVSPMTRGMKYAALVSESLDLAEKANPRNPRTYLVRGNDFKFRPKMFGGGAEAARPWYDKAKAAFETFAPASSIAPNWGRGQLTGILKSYETPAASAQ
jgi:hypothetical protein